MYASFHNNHSTATTGIAYQYLLPFITHIRGKVLKDTAALGVENAERLSKVVSLYTKGKYSLHKIQTVLHTRPLTSNREPSELYSEASVDFCGKR